MNSADYGWHPLPPHAQPILTSPDESPHRTLLLFWHPWSCTPKLIGHIHACLVLPDPWSQTLLSSALLIPVLLFLLYLEPSHPRPEIHMLPEKHTRVPSAEPDVPKTCCGRWQQAIDESELTQLTFQLFLMKNAKGDKVGLLHPGAHTAQQRRAANGNDEPALQPTPRIKTAAPGQMALSNPEYCCSSENRDVTLGCTSQVVPGEVEVCPTQPLLVSCALASRMTQAQKR